MKRPLLYVLVGVVAFLVVFGGTLWNAIVVHRAGPEIFGRVPPFKFSAASAKGSTTLGSMDLQGHPWVANFIFTHCSGPCPRMSAQMAELQNILPKEVRLVTFTVDPDRDTPEVLTEYARRFEADPERWIFVCADKRALYKLVFEGFKLPMMEDPSAESGYRVTHSTKFVLVDGQGRIRRYFESSTDNMKSKIVKAANALATEKA